jgi:hypothetical protein
MNRTCTNRLLSVSHDECRCIKAASALWLLARAQALGHLWAEWVTGDGAYGKSPEFGEGVDAYVGLIFDRGVNRPVRRAP